MQFLDKTICVWVCYNKVAVLKACNFIKNRIQFVQCSTSVKDYAFLHGKVAIRPFNANHWKSGWVLVYFTLHEKWRFPFRISSVNVTKSTVSCVCYNKVAVLKACNFIKNRIQFVQCSTSVKDYAFLHGKVAIRPFNANHWKSGWVLVYFTLHEKWRFPFRISSVNVTKFTVSCGFGHIYRRNP